VIPEVMKDPDVEGLIWVGEFAYRLDPAYAPEAADRAAAAKKLRDRLVAVLNATRDFPAEAFAKDDVLAELLACAMLVIDRYRRATGGSYSEQCRCEFCQLEAGIARFRNGETWPYQTCARRS